MYVCMYMLSFSVPSSGTETTHTPTCKHELASPLPTASAPSTHACVYVCEAPGSNF